jgi:DNA-binding MarR family transcriptional regulator
MMDTSDDTYWNASFPIILDRINAVMRRNMMDVVKPYGLTSSHSIYLLALHIQDGQTMVELSNYLDLDPANTNRVVKKLREEKFVFDDRKEDNNKKYSIFLTDSGKKLATEIMISISEIIRNIFANFSEEMILFMRGSVVEMMKNLEMLQNSENTNGLQELYFRSPLAVPANRDFITLSKNIDRKNNDVIDEDEDD